MSEGGTISRSASALRTALVGQAMVRFDAPQLVGPSPEAGRTIERVERRGRHVEVEWDDGLVLDTNLRLAGSWHLYRAADPWRRPYRQMRATIEVDDWVAVCFNAPVVETHRVPDRRRHPGMGRLGPDLGRPDTDLSAVVNLLLSFPDPSARLGEVLLDQRVGRGVGNVDRCEVLWADELSPFAPVGALGEHDAVRLVNTVARLARSTRHRPRRVTAAGIRVGSAVYGRTGQPCHRCGSTIAARRCGVPRRTLYWCPGCQLHLDPKLGRADDDVPMDPHPAAARFLADLPWNRETG